jgi:hypothetical protein
VLRKQECQRLFGKRDGIYPLSLLFILLATNQFASSKIPIATDYVPSSSRKRTQEPLCLRVRVGKKTTHVLQNASTIRHQTNVCLASEMLLQNVLQQYASVYLLLVARHIPSLLPLFLITRLFPFLRKNEIDGICIPPLLKSSGRRSMERLLCVTRDYTQQGMFCGTEPLKTLSTVHMERCDSVQKRATKISMCLTPTGARYINISSLLASCILMLHSNTRPSSFLQKNQIHGLCVPFFQKTSDEEL